MSYNIIVLIFFGILPSAIWLSYYLTKDLHPEPKKMILKIFFWGVLSTCPVFFVQIWLSQIIESISVNQLTRDLIYWFLIVALSEEVFKYLVVKFKVINSQHLDEPLDLMLYMVVAALGFAALENVLYLFAPMWETAPFDQLMTRILVIDIVRFLGAVFLHTLCSATIGYFMAISICKARFKKITLLVGIVIATLLHGLYNFLIMNLDGDAKYIAPAILVLIMAFFVFWGFEKIKKMKGVCEVKKISA